MGTRSCSRQRGAILVPVLFVLLVIGLLWWSRYPVMRWMGTRLEESEAPKKADAVLVLAGGTNGDRILKGGQLVRDGYAPLALFSGAHTNYDTLECDWAIPYAVKRGYPASIYACVPHDGRSTREEAQFLIAELRRRQAKTVLLVTSDFHTKRAGWLYRKMAPEIEFVVIGSPAGTMKLDRWWETREGRKTWFLESVKSVSERFGI